MLEVVFYRDARKRPAAIAAHGHARGGRYGKDIVCAAASAVLQAARLGLEEHAGLRLDALAEPGEFSLRWPAKTRDDASVKAIVATAELAVREIARQYPRHVRVRRITEKAG